MLTVCNDSFVSLESRVTLRIYEHRSPFNNPRAGSVEYGVSAVVGQLDETIGRGYLLLPLPGTELIDLFCIECDTRKFTTTVIFPAPNEVG
jgi:hypothetical protein